MKPCQKCSINEARYINGANEWLCGVCDVLSPWRSVRISDIGELVRKTDDLIHRVVASGDMIRLYREARACAVELDTITSAKTTKPFNRFNGDLRRCLQCKQSFAHPLHNPQTPMYDHEPTCLAIELPVSPSK